MARPRTYKTEAVVLKQTPLGEADRILTLYAPDVGKIRAVAKGIRRTKSKQSGNLELLNQVSISLSEGRNLDVVNESDVVQSFRGFKENLQMVSKGIYVAELMDAFSVEQSGSYSLYQLLVQTLEWMSKAQNSDLLLRFFELHLLDCTGYRPEVYNCVECYQKLDPENHLFCASHGGVLCPGCRTESDEVMIPISLNAMKVLRFLMRAARYDKVDELTVPSNLNWELERFLRNYIQFVIEKDFKSAEFMHLVSFR